MEDDENISQRCYGEGGGGSGGVVYFKTALPAGSINVSGGAKGARMSSLNCATIVSSTAGSAGVTVPNYVYMQSSALSTYCGAVLDVDLLWFQAQAR